MVDGGVDEAIEVFIEGFAHLQRVSGPVERRAAGAIPFLHFAAGRRGTAFTEEFFPIRASPPTAIAAVRVAAPGAHHYVSALGPDALAEVSAYEAAGYVHWGQETLMARSLDVPIGPPPVAVAPVDRADLAQRIMDAERAADVRIDPISPAHLADPALLHRVVLVDGAPASIGRVVLLGAEAYVSDVVTLPAFRRRGLADALMRRLLLDARERGARRCVLTSSVMGEPLYRALGFRGLTTLAGYASPEAAPG